MGDLPREFISYVSSLLMALAVVALYLYSAPVWDRVTRWRIHTLYPRLEELRLATSQLPTYLRWWSASLVAAFILFAIFGMFPIAVVAALLIYIAPGVLLDRVIHQRTIVLRDQMVGACTALANSTRAGLTLEQAFEAVTDEMPEPLATEFRRIVSDYRRGRPLRDALVQTKDRLQIDSFSIFTAALLVAKERGGNISAALDRIGRSLQETQRLERKLEADTESGRKVVMILAGFPFLFLALFSILTPEGVGYLFTRSEGQIVLAVVIGLAYISTRWSSRILTIDV